MSTYLASRIRTSARALRMCDQTWDEIVRDLLATAAMVERQEHQLDMVFREAREAYHRARTVAELARLTEVAP